MFHSYVSLPEGNYSHMKQHIQNICTVHGWWVALQLYQVNIAGLRLDPSENQPSIYLQRRIPVIPLHYGRKRGSTNNPVDRFGYDTVWYDKNIPVTLGRWSTFWNLQNLLQFLRTNCRNHPSHTIRIAIPEYLCYPIHKWLYGFETILAKQLYIPWNDCRSIGGNSKEHHGEPTGVNFGSLEWSLQI